MIKSQREYRFIKAQALKFEQALAELASKPTTIDAHARLRQAEEQGMRSQLASLRREIEQYEALHYERYRKSRD
jgi:hypothetical protein